MGATTTQAGKLPDMFTPKDMLLTPRPQHAIASPDKTHAISAVDKWDPDTDKIYRTVYLLSLNTTHTRPISLLNTTSKEADQFFWLDSNNIAYLRNSTIYSISINFSTTGSSIIGSKPKELLSFPEGINPTGIQFNHKTGLLGFSGQIWKDSGDFEETQKLNKKFEERGDSALVYDELFVRHWDEWRIPGKLWTLGITQLNNKSGIWEIERNEKGQKFVNLLNDTGLYSKMNPISFSLTSNAIALSIKTPHLPYATHTREDIYLISLSENLTPSSPRHITPHDHGAISAVTFSPDGKKLAWLEMKKDGYESDKRVIVVHEEGKSPRKWTEDWDRSPESLVWSLDSKSLYFAAEHHGRTLPYHLTHPDHLPTPLYFNGSTISITPLTSHTILLAIQTLTSPLDEFILTLPDPEKKHTELEGNKDGDKLPHDSLKRLTAWSADSIKDRLEPHEGEEFWFKGSEGKDVMGWTIRPRGWEEGQKKEWPLAFFIHGGPQGAWEDSWNTRWHLSLFAAQGYFVIAINPTGSTGYGQEFVDAIQNEWGGKPFKDLLAGYHFALERYPEIDRDRTIALGASYGGYMINWINGHNEHFGFKALVNHDGAFDTVSSYFATEELWFPTQDFAGTPITNRNNYEKWNPRNHVIEWTTPELVIQGGKDYRVEESQGLSTFTALQSQGIPSRFVYFPDENHWITKPHNSLRWHTEVLRWLHEWVGKAHGDDLEKEAKEENHPFVIQQ